ncbi:helix-turn-helix transcriptional regulator [Ruegeria atlantica]|uniref:helix-turn-helix transcriptional regulator n=1 Tax=Ruegeria atlantica TaxID=81569 RepID=UPI0024958549|nr:LuxR C-terminal-related transcriptional regulator [Ruegeria atlantica]
MNLLSFTRWFALFDGRTVNILLLDSDGNISAIDSSEQEPEQRKLTLHWRELQFGDVLHNKMFERLILASLRYSFENVRPFPPPITVPIPDGRRICIDVMPLPEEFKLALGHAHALLNFRELETYRSLTHDRLREHFGLTPSEATLAKALTEGESLKEASSRLEISIWTARSHLRSIFQKTDTHRQAELVSLITHIDH